MMVSPVVLRYDHRVFERTAMYIVFLHVILSSFCTELASVDLFAAFVLN